MSKHTAEELIEIVEKEDFRRIIVFGGENQAKYMEIIKDTMDFVIYLSIIEPMNILRDYRSTKDSELLKELKSMEKISRNLFMVLQKEEIKNVLYKHPNYKDYVSEILSHSQCHCCEEASRLKELLTQNPNVDVSDIIISNIRQGPQSEFIFSVLMNHVYKKPLTKEQRDRIVNMIGIHNHLDYDIYMFIENYNSKCAYSNTLNDAFDFDLIYNTIIIREDTPIYCRMKLLRMLSRYRKEFGDKIKDKKWYTDNPNLFIKHPNLKNFVIEMLDEIPTNWSEAIHDNHIAPAVTKIITRHWNDSEQTRKEMRGVAECLVKTDSQRALSLFDKLSDDELSKINPQHEDEFLYKVFDFKAATEKFKTRDKNRVTKIMFPFR